MGDEDDKDYVNFTFDMESWDAANWYLDPEEDMTDEEKVWHRLKYGPPQKRSIEDELRDIMADEIRNEIDREILNSLKRGIK